MESHNCFNAVDLPAADEFIHRILAAVAQRKTTAISSRKQDALAGVVTAQHSDKPAHRQAAQLARLLRSLLVVSLREIAAHLREPGYKIRSSKPFTAWLSSNYCLHKKGKLSVWLSVNYWLGSYHQQKPDDSFPAST
ncbi:hypothetical protein [Hymenobacter sp. DG01]|uniref:hypothetical protein n=1 Tax=Hymenobacter sp. DG01 TaxID=2584940 RepID=UPI00111E7900|nr:hypothetical protein [Hymenobacter sp. DG01]